MRTRLCHHFQAIANLPPNVYMDDDPNIPNLKHTDNLQLMREVAVDVLTKHARVRSQKRYVKILNDINRLMFAHEKSIELDPLETSMIDIGVILWLLPVVRRWRLVRKAVAVCAMGPADLMWKRPFIFYGMHAVTIGHYAIDDRPVEVVDIGERGRTVVGVKYMHGAQLTVMCPHGVPVGFQVLAQGTEGSFHACDMDAAYFYSTMLKDFMAMVVLGEQTFDLLKALEVFQICCAQEESVRTGRPVRLG